MLSSLSRFFGGEADRDGQSADLEQFATDISLDEAPPPDDRHRRNRPLAGGSAEVSSALSAKVLNAWLQNRHQTLFPLSVNFNTLTPEGALALVRFMAVASLAGTGTRTDRHEAMQGWLSSAGASEDVVAAFWAALDAPMPLSRAIASVQETGVSALAYVAALIASRRREPADELFVDYLAVRLGLPTTVIRSADRRYRS